MYVGRKITLGLTGLILAKYRRIDGLITLLIAAGYRSLTEYHEPPSRAIMKTTLPALFFLLPVSCQKWAGMLHEICPPIFSCPELSVKCAEACTIKPSPKFLRALHMLAGFADGCNGALPKCPLLRSGFPESGFFRLKDRALFISLL